MNFYLAAVDDTMRHPDDRISIGLILCKTKNRIIAEYALRNSTTPIGITEFGFIADLPAQLKGTLPTIEEIESELATINSNPKLVAPKPKVLARPRQRSAGIGPPRRARS